MENLELFLWLGGIILVGGTIGYILSKNRFMGILFGFLAFIGTLLYILKEVIGLGKKKVSDKVNKRKDEIEKKDKEVEDRDEEIKDKKEEADKKENSSDKEEEKAKESEEEYKKMKEENDEEIEDKKEEGEEDKEDEENVDNPSDYLNDIINDRSSGE